jgi:hypothetical protein
VSDSPAPAELCSDDELGYQRNRTPFVASSGLALDATYRLAHLPWVAPDHPRVIPAREGSGYRMGRHARVFSLVLPVPASALLASPHYERFAFWSVGTSV